MWGCSRKPRGGGRYQGGVYGLPNVHWEKCLHGLYLLIHHDFSLVNQPIVDLTHEIIHTAPRQLQPHHLVPVRVGEIGVADTIESHAGGYPVGRAV